MRQSLSERRHSIGRPEPSPRGSSVGSTTVALLLAAALAVAGLIDQLGGRSLMDHATAMYEAHGKDADAALMYGLIYTVAAIDVVLWSLVYRLTRSGRRPAAVPATVATVATVVAGGLAAVLLGSQEYGEQIFPTFWGLLALLSPIAGVVVCVQLFRRRPA